MNSNESFRFITFQFNINKSRQIYCLGKSHCKTRKEKRIRVHFRQPTFYMKGSEFGEIYSFILSLFLTIHHK